MTNVLKHKIVLWLDDYRDPYTDNMAWARLFSPIPINNSKIVWVKNYDEFCAWITDNGIPDAICFDHDLADINDNNEKTGYDCAKFLGEYCIEHKLSVPLYSIQSSNPVGKENIDAYLKNVIKYMLLNI